MSEYEQSQETELLEDQLAVLDDHEQDDDEGLSLDALINDAQEEAEQEAAPSKEEAAADRERAERLAARFNNGLWWGLSKAYPAAEVSEDKIEAGKEALIPLAEKYGDSMPSWIDDFMEKPEIKAGLYVGTAIMAARASHMAAIEAEQKQGGEVGKES